MKNLIKKQTHFHPTRRTGKESGKALLLAIFLSGIGFTTMSFALKKRSTQLGSVQYENQRDDYNKIFDRIGKTVNCQAMAQEYPTCTDGTLVIPHYIHTSGTRYPLFAAYTDHPELGMIGQIGQFATRLTCVSGEYHLELAKLTANDSVANDPLRRSIKMDFDHSLNKKMIQSRTQFCGTGSTTGSSGNSLHSHQVFENIDSDDTGTFTFTPATENVRIVTTNENFVLRKMPGAGSTVTNRILPGSTAGIEDLYECTISIELTQTGQPTQTELIFNVASEIGSGHYHLFSDKNFVVVPGIPVTVSYPRYQDSNVTSCATRLPGFVLGANDTKMTARVFQFY